MSALAACALAGEGARSHLPEQWQRALGQEGPHASDSPVAEVGIAPPRAVEGTWAQSGWGHEAYLRSRGLDVSGVCREAHRGIPWIEGSWHWEQFYAWCAEHPSGDVVAHYGRYYGEAVSARCKGLVGDGWMVGDGGGFYRPGAPGTGPRPQFPEECMGGDETPFVHVRDYTDEESDRISIRIAIRDLDEEWKLTVPYGAPP